MLPARQLRFLLDLHVQLVGGRRRRGRLFACRRSVTLCVPQSATAWSTWASMIELTIVKCLQGSFFLVVASDAVVLFLFIGRRLALHGRWSARHGRVSGGHEQKGRAQSPINEASSRTRENTGAIATSTVMSAASMGSPLDCATATTTPSPTTTQPDAPLQRRQTRSTLHPSNTRRAGVESAAHETSRFDSAKAAFSAATHAYCAMLPCIVHMGPARRNYMSAGLVA